MTVGGTGAGAGDAGLGGKGPAGSGGTGVLRAGGWDVTGFGISGSDIAVASRGTNLLDLLAVSDDGGLALSRYDGIWHAPVTIPAPLGVVLHAVAAVADGPCLEVMAAGDDHKLYSTRASCGVGELTFESWSEIDGAVTLGEPDSLSLVAWPGYDRWDAFWTMPSGNMGHAWGPWGPNASYYYSLESGDDRASPYLVTVAPAHRLNAVMAGPARIDIFTDGGPQFCFQHHWYDGYYGAWGEEDVLHREQRLCVVRDASGNHLFQTSGDFVLLSDTPGTYEVLVIDPGAKGGRALRLAHVAVDGAAGPSSGELWFEDMGALSAPPQRVVDGIAWRDSSLRHDVFGLYDDSSSVWQFIYP